MTAEIPDERLITAQWTAAARARETARPDALFADPWATHLAGEATAWLERQPAEAGLAPVLRTRFLDDLIEQCLHQTTIRQVVFVAAGLDMRAYRLAWPPGTRLFELDQNGVLSYKEHILVQQQILPGCQRICVPADLTQAWAEGLIRAGFERHQPTLWMVEGLLMYLGVAPAQRLMATLSELASPLSWLGLDVIQKSAPTYRQLRALRTSKSPPISTGHFGVDEPQSWLEDLGWKASISTVEETGRHYGRWPSPSAVSARAGWPTLVLVAAQREAAQLHPEPQGDASFL